MQLAIPFGGDQFANGNECIKLGIGESIQFFSVTEENLKETVNKLLSNPSYGARFDNSLDCISQNDYHERA